MIDLSNLLNELQAGREEAAERVAALTSQRDEAVADLEKLDQMIRAGRGPQRRKASSGGGTAAVSPEVVEAVLSQARTYAQQEGPAAEIVRGSFTRAMLVHDINLHPSSVDKALRQLREGGKIRQLGRKRIEGSPRASNLLVLVDEQ